MTDIPIIMSGQIVLALLHARKTMTRRMLYVERKAKSGIIPASATFLKGHPPPVASTPYRYYALSGWWRAKPGCRLWVRENFRVQQVNRIVDANGPYLHVCIDYAADDHRAWIKVYENVAPKILQRRGTGLSGEQTKLLPAIHLPKVASRLTLSVASTKIERLQDITKEDVIAEGISERDGEPISDVHAGWHEPFAALWDSLHGDGAWGANPKVIPLSFSVRMQNIDTMPKQEAA